MSRNYTIMFLPLPEMAPIKEWKSPKAFKELFLLNEATIQLDFGQELMQIL